MSKYLTTAEAAEVAEVCQKTIVNWINDGVKPAGRGSRNKPVVRLRTERKGKRHRITRAALDEFQAQVNGTPAPGASAAPGSAPPLPSSSGDPLPPSPPASGPPLGS